MKRVVIGGLAAVVLAAAVGCGGASSSSAPVGDKRSQTGDPNTRMRTDGATTPPTHSK